ncbi:transcriptional regulator [Roseomonas chloroacetimidivorans]|uniref:transcriptional regulator n=1 Tax=Roseomonas chloroacetimidivorans TaxID=1766656 RepID=UPI003C76FF90
MTPEQCQAARSLLGWTEWDLALHSGVTVGTVMYFEMGNGRPRRATVSALHAALEAAGVIFVDENSERPGVRLKKRQP